MVTIWEEVFSVVGAARVCAGVAVIRFFAGRPLVKYLLVVVAGVFVDVFRN